MQTPRPNMSPPNSHASLIPLYPNKGLFLLYFFPFIDFFFSTQSFNVSNISISIYSSSFRLYVISIVDWNGRARAGPTGLVHGVNEQESAAITVVLEDRSSTTIK